MRDLFEHIIKINNEHPEYKKSDEYIGKDYVVGLCDDALSTLTSIYHKSKNKKLIGDYMELFKEMKKIRLETISGVLFENNVASLLC